MFRLPILSIWVVMLAALSLGLAQDAGKDKKPVKELKDAKQADYFPLRAGHAWNYRVTIDGKVSKVTKRIEKVDTADGAITARISASNSKLTETVRVSAKGVFRASIDDDAVNPALCLLKYPTKVNDKWEGEFTIVGEPGKVTYGAEIQKEDDVAVPAGKFKALRVAVEHKEKDQAIRTTYWFAANVGIVKQTFEPTGTTITLELEKFEPKK